MSPGGGDIATGWKFLLIFMCSWINRNKTASDELCSNFSLLIPSMIKKIVELVLSEASNFDLMYTATEVAVEQSSIFTNLCRQGTEMLYDNVEKVFSNFVYPLHQNLYWRERLLAIAPQILRQTRITLDFVMLNRSATDRRHSGLSCIHIVINTCFCKSMVGLPPFLCPWGRPRQVANKRSKQLTVVLDIRKWLKKSETL